MAVGDGLSKLNTDARATIMLAFEDLGGLPRLVAWANDPNNPSNLSTFYTQIWAKIIPKEVQAKIDSNQRMNIVWDDDGQVIEDYVTDDGFSVTDIVSEDDE